MCCLQEVRKHRLSRKHKETQTKQKAFYHHIMHEDLLMWITFIIVFNPKKTKEQKENRKKERTKRRKKTERRMVCTIFFNYSVSLFPPSLPFPFPPPLLAPYPSTFSLFSFFPFHPPSSPSLVQMFKEYLPYISMKNCICF